ncbi:hypothetical protein [Variovorax boronicumulans]|uniref:hypothetical protein n=1 Tax=Variovorax boronicumulans TaxID=436515 RepID=UPI001C564B00
MQVATQSGHGGRLDEAFCSLPAQEARHLHGLLRRELADVAIVYLGHGAPEWLAATRIVRLDAAA